MIKREIKERHKHDCDCCIYLGSVFNMETFRTSDIATAHEDVYYCPQDDGMLGSVISRSSSEPSDYASSPFNMACYNRTCRGIQEGVREILNRGYITINKEKLKDI